PLYSGQEASTRYLDFSKQSLIDPYNNPTSAKILKDWISLYDLSLEQTIEALKKRFPFDNTQYKSEKIWENTIKARAFDICRSLLPVGTATLLSWSTNLRQVRDNLRRLKNHPLPEVQELAQVM